MEISKAERLQLLMMCDIYRTLEIDNSFDPDVIEEAITSGNFWAIELEYQSLDAEPVSQDTVRFVSNVLDMFTGLKATYDMLEQEDKDALARDIPHFSVDSSLTFEGFDGNNESTHFGITHMFNKMGRFTTTANLTANSHMPVVGLYSRMLDVYTPLRGSFTHHNGIGFENLKAVLLERTHPSNR